MSFHSAPRHFTSHNLSFCHNLKSLPLSVFFSISPYPDFFHSSRWLSHRLLLNFFDPLCFNCVPEWHSDKIRSIWKKSGSPSNLLHIPLCNLICWGLFPSEVTLVSNGNFFFSDSIYPCPATSSSVTTAGDTSIMENFSMLSLFKASQKSISVYTPLFYADTSSPDGSGVVKQSACSFVFIFQTAGSFLCFNHWLEILICPGGWYILTHKWMCPLHECWVDAQIIFNCVWPRILILRCIENTMGLPSVVVSLLGLKTLLYFINIPPGPPLYPLTPLFEDSHCKFSQTAEDWSKMFYPASLQEMLTKLDPLFATTMAGNPCVSKMCSNFSAAGCNGVHEMCIHPYQTGFSHQQKQFSLRSHKPYTVSSKVSHATT